MSSTKYMQYIAVTTPSGEYRDVVPRRVLTSLPGRETLLGQMLACDRTTQKLHLPRDVPVWLLGKFVALLEDATLQRQCQHLLRFKHGSGLNQLRQNESRHALIRANLQPPVFPTVAPHGSSADIDEEHAELVTASDELPLGTAVNMAELTDALPQVLLVINDASALHNRSLRQLRLDAQYLAGNSLDLHVVYRPPKFCRFLLSNTLRYCRRRSPQAEEKDPLGCLVASAVRAVYNSCASSIAVGLATFRAFSFVVESEHTLTIRSHASRSVPPVWSLTDTSIESLLSLKLAIQETLDELGRDCGFLTKTSPSRLVFVLAAPPPIPLCASWFSSRAGAVSVQAENMFTPPNLPVQQLAAAGADVAAANALGAGRHAPRRQLNDRTDEAQDIEAEATAAAAAGDAMTLFVCPDVSGVNRFWDAWSTNFCMDYPSPGDRTPYNSICLVCLRKQRIVIVGSRSVRSGTFLTGPERLQSKDRIAHNLGTINLSSYGEMNDGPLDDNDHGVTGELHDAHSDILTSDGASEHGDTDISSGMDDDAGASFRSFDENYIRPAQDYFVLRIKNRSHVAERDARMNLLKGFTNEKESSSG
ncbi:MAG: hypothetical protein MHM6MM_003291 [Cercozoa sp. M6MM]